MCGTPKGFKLQINMIIGWHLLWFLVSGIAWHFMDRSEEGKLTKHRYWNKNYLPKDTEWEWFGFEKGQGMAIFEREQLWWKVGWLIKFKWIPASIAQYLPFHDGWHLLKFVMKNAAIVGVCLIAGVEGWWLNLLNYIIIYITWSAGETVLRKLIK